MPTLIPTARRIRLILLILWLFPLVFGAYGVYQRFAFGHLPAGYGSYVPWGLWVAFYFHGVGIAGGAFAIAALGFIFEWPGFRSRAALRTAIVVSAAGILPAFFGVWVDLGHLERAFSIFTHASFTSMMAFNAWMYSAYLVIAIAAWILSFRDDRQWLKPLICLAALFCVLFPSQSGAFFGVVDAKPFWHSALLPMMFLTSAFAAGSAVLLVVRMLQGAFHLTSWDAGVNEDYESAVRLLRKICLISVVVYFLFEFAEFSIVMWSPFSHAPALELVLFGPYWWVFWIVHLLIGGVIALILLASRKPAVWTLGGVLVAVCFISARLNVLVPGQAVGEIQGLQEAFYHERLQYIYHATPMEYFVGGLMIALAMFIFVAGEWISALLSKNNLSAQNGNPREK
jgi:molybdopterin-containing oxidoreductase family membrane subunit